jgi:hypothetical protein
MMDIRRNTAIFGFVLLIGVLCVLHGCGIFDTDSELAPIEGEISFSVKEGYADYLEIAEPKIFLSLSTEKIYPCCNWSIVSKIVFQRDVISVELLGIYIPDICLTALGPATSKSFLGLVEGQYVLKFSYRSVTDIYDLVLSDSSIAIKEIASTLTTPSCTLFCRYPRKSFAYICGTTDETSWVYKDFLDTLLSKVDLEEFHFPDYGEIPYPQSSSGHSCDMPAKYFLYEKEPDFERAGEILESYTKSVIVQHPGASISLINWMNKRYCSWLLDD